MTETICIRHARVDDAADIARVHIDTWRTTNGGIVPDEHLANLDIAIREQRWRERLITPEIPMLIYVVETNSGEIVGFAMGGAERENDPVYKGELYGDIHFTSPSASGHRAKTRRGHHSIFATTRIQQYVDLVSRR